MMHHRFMVGILVRVFFGIEKCLIELGVCEKCRHSRKHHRVIYCDHGFNPVLSYVFRYISSRCWGIPQVFKPYYRDDVLALLRGIDIISAGNLLAVIMVSDIHNF